MQDSVSPRIDMLGFTVDVRLRNRSNQTPRHESQLYERRLSNQVNMTRVVCSGSVPDQNLGWGGSERSRVQHGTTNEIVGSCGLGWAADGEREKVNMKCSGYSQMPLNVELQHCG